ncbi:MAG: PorP/SprF family type IX secretion system membrane protein [Saprospiraceae bacterium]
MLKFMSYEFFLAIISFLALEYQFDIKNKMLKKNSFLCLFFIVALLLEIQSQQLPQLSQQMLYKYQYNPAYGGMERSLNIISIYRAQYLSLVGSPKILNLSIDLPLYRLHGAGGVSFYQANSGLISNSNVKFSYNYVQGFEFGLVSIGGRLGIDRIVIDNSAITTPGGDYATIIDHNDPILYGTKAGISPTYELGLYFMSRSYQCGLTFADYPGFEQINKDKFYKKSWYSTMFFEYTNRSLEAYLIKPSILIKANSNVIQTDLNAVIEHKDGLLGGISFRGYDRNSIDAIVIMAGGRISNNLRVVYSYDMGISSLKTVHEGSHEISFSYGFQTNIGRGQALPVIYNTRDL